MVMHLSSCIFCTCKRSALVLSVMHVYGFRQHRYAAFGLFIVMMYRRPADLHSRGLRRHFVVRPVVLVRCRSFRPQFFISSLLYYSFNPYSSRFNSELSYQNVARWRSNHQDLTITESGHVRILALHHPLHLLPHHCNKTISIPIHLFEDHSHLFTAREISERSVGASMRIAHPC